MTHSDQLQAVIVGGGISGLSAAYYLSQQAKEHNLPLSISVVEKEERLGGKIQTIRQDGFVIEQGPDSFLRRKPAVIALSKELGMDKKWVGMGPHASRTYIVHQGKLHLLPQGLMLGVPLRLGPFLKTGLISPLGKLRAALDFVLPRKQDGQDESLGHFLKRRLGPEVVEKIAEPLLSGIYAGDAYRLSLKATFPQFRELEQKYGSLIRGMRQSQHQNVTQSPQSTENMPTSIFLSFQNGLYSLIEALENQLQEEVTFHLSAEAAALEKEDGKYILHLADGQKLRADILILATPASITAQMFTDEKIKKPLQAVRYVSVANVVLAFEEKGSNIKLDGSGFLVPRGENFSVTAATWTSVKWPHTAPPGKILIRTYLGRENGEDLLHLEDQELVQLVRKEMKQIIGLDQEPLFYHVNRWPQSMPQYQIGHVERLQTVQEHLASAYPGLFLCGAGYRGIGIPDCIAQGKAAALEAFTFLINNKKPVRA